MITQPLSTRAMDEIATIFNAVYEGYVAPVNMSAELIEQHITSNDIDLDASPLWLDDDGSLIATALLGIREDRGWVGGFGVTTAYRGRGISHQLIQAVIGQAGKLNLREIALEVITTNTAAIRTYQRANFIHHRDLLIFRRRPTPLNQQLDTTDVTSADPSTLLAHRPAEAATPAWQRDRVSPLGDPSLSGLAIGAAESPQAMLVYVQSDPNFIRIADIAATNTDAAQTLLAGLIERNPNASIALVNEPEESNVVPAIQSLGWEEVMRQHEMLYTIGIR